MTVMKTSPSFPKIKIEMVAKRSLGHNIVVFRSCTIKRCILVLCIVYSSGRGLRLERAKPSSHSQPFLHSKGTGSITAAGYYEAPVTHQGMPLVQFVPKVFTEFTFQPHSLCIHKVKSFKEQQDIQVAFTSSIKKKAK